MATEDPQESKSTSAVPPKRTRKRSARTPNGATGDHTEASGNGMLDDANLPPPAEDDTPASGSPRITVPPPPGGYAPAPQPAPVASAPAPAPVNTYYAPPPPAPKRGGGFGRALARLAGWVFAALFGLGVGLLIFALAPVAFQRILAPVTQNTEEVSRLDTELGDISEQIEDIQAEQVEQDRALIDAQGSAEARIADAEGRLADTEARLHDAEDALAEQTRLINDLEETLNQQAEQLEKMTDTLAALQAELPGQAEYNEYNRQLLLTRAWQELLRARLRLLENNPGAALDELASARTTLSQVVAMSDADQQADVNEVIERVDMVIEEITENPFAATGDLEIAWQMLGTMITPPGLLPAPAAETPTPTVEPTQETTDEP